MNKQTEVNASNVKQVLVNALGAEMASNILAVITTKTPQAEKTDFLEVKALSEMVEQIRADAMHNVKAFKKWRKTQDYTGYNNPLFVKQGTFYARRAKESLELYKEARTAFWQAYRQAMQVFEASMNQKMA